MKAEHRKELETNTLADRMGHMVQRVKTSQRRTVLTYVLITVGAVVAVWLGYRWWYSGVEEASERWFRFYDGAGPHLALIMESDPKSVPGKAARLQIAWFLYWNEGVKWVGADPRRSITNLREASKAYAALVDDCEGDKVLQPQAMLGQAAAEETLAVLNPANLKKATELYQALVDKHGTSAEAHFARQRLEILNDAKKSAELADNYAQIDKLLNVRFLAGLQMPKLPDLKEGPK